MVELAALCIVLVVGVPLVVFALNFVFVLTYYLARSFAYLAAAIILMPWIVAVFLWKTAWPFIKGLRRGSR